MPWEAWVLIAMLVFSIIVSIYRIDRPRKTAGPIETFFGCLEFGFYIWCVLSLVSKIG